MKNIRGIVYHLSYTIGATAEQGIVYFADVEVPGNGETPEYVRINLTKKQYHEIARDSSIGFSVDEREYLRHLSLPRHERNRGPMRIGEITLEQVVCD